MAAASVIVTFQENSVHDLEVNDAIASRMSLFYAHATPMLKVLSDTTSKFVSEVITSYNASTVTFSALKLTLLVGLQEGIRFLTLKKVGWLNNN